MLSFQNAPSGSVKVRFLKLFPKYVGWEKDMIGDSFDLVILSKSDTIYQEMKVRMKETSVNDKPVKVHLHERLSDVKNCDMLFVSSGEEYDVNKINKKYPKNVLIVTDQLKEGIDNSMINFVKDSKRLKFELNLASIKKSGLAVNENLSAVAAETIE